MNVPISPADKLEYGNPMSNIGRRHIIRSEQKSGIEIWDVLENLFKPVELMLHAFPSRF